MTGGGRFARWGIVAGCALLLTAQHSPLLLAYGPPDESGGTATATSATGDDVQDLVYLSPKRPMLMRLHLRIDGQPLSELHATIARQLFEALDADGNGILEGKERSGIPPAEVLAVIGKAGTIGQAASGPQSIRAVPNGRVTPDELAAYLQPFVMRPFRLAVEAVQNSAAKSPGEGPVRPGLYGYQQTGSLDMASFLALLDTDGDGRLTVAECERVDELFRMLDLNDDETISRAEIAEVAAARNSQRLGTSSPLGDVASLLRPIDRAGSQAELVGALAQRYRRMSPADIVKWLVEATPQFELDVALPKKTLQRPTVALRPGAASADEEGIGVRTGAAGEVVLVLSRVPIELHAAEAPPRPVSRMAYARGLFKRADQDGNKYLDAKEVAAADLGLGPEEFKAIDRDHNGMIFEEEWLSFMTLYDIVSEYRITLTVSATAIDPIAKFDSNEDGRLTHGEWARALATVRSWDTDHDGRISPAEIPRHFEGTFHLGALRLAVNRSSMSEMTPPAASPSAAPAWFQKMDRNRDGEVSFREFLGPLSVFRRLDTNHDGYLDAKEAQGMNAGRAKDEGGRRQDE